MVQVKFNSVEQALRKLKKSMQLEGIFRVMRMKKAYEKPSERRVRKQKESARRRIKIAYKSREAR
ncbi:MAG: 30S ribosomal protein S21 [Proteobacteria bacterium]|nr:30S ribosomal protein S21 [Pseudomonadota bacterium]